MDTTVAPPPRDDTSTALRVGAWVIGSLDGVAMLWWVGLGLKGGPTFAEIFADFGATLPWATRLVIHPAFGLGVAVAGALTLAGTALAPLRPLVRVALLGALLVAHFVGSGLAVYAVYAPIFAMAEQIR